MTASPSLSPGRRIIRTVPQSPAFGFRASTAALAPSVVVAARQTRSTSDLNQAQHRFDPARITGGGAPRGTSPLPGVRPVVGHEESRSPAAEPHLTSGGLRAPASVRHTSPVSSVSGGGGGLGVAGTARAATFRQRHTAGVIWPGVARSSSVEPCAPQWAGGAPPVSAVAATPPAEDRAPARSCSPRPQCSGQAIPYTPKLRKPQSQPQSLQQVSTNVRLFAVPGQAAQDAQQEVGQVQMTTFRASLVQHIQSMQKEITRIELEKQQAQSSAGGGTSAPVQVPASAAGSAPLPMRSPSVTAREPCSGASTRIATSGGAVGAGRAVSVVSSRRTRPTSVTQVRPAAAAAQQMRSIQQDAAMHHHQVQRGRQAMTVSHTTLTAAKPASLAVMAASPLATSPRASTGRIISGPQAVWRQPPHQVAALLPATVPAAAALPPSVCAPPPTEVQLPAMPQLSQEAASIRIQRLWRRRRSAVPVPAEPAESVESAAVAFAGSASLGAAAPEELVDAAPARRIEQAFALRCAPAAAVHHAAARIQRAWKIGRWRRRFVDFSERDVGWLGRLDWLQHHNLLYGTELADPEDVSEWVQHHSEAPLDHEVDPWGSVKLRSHLNKMWYGHVDAEDEEYGEPEEIGAAPVCEEAAVAEAVAEALPSPSEMQQLQAGQALEAAAAAPMRTCAVRGTSVAAKVTAATWRTSVVAAVAPAAANAPRRSPPCTERVPPAAVVMSKAMSLSPRRDSLHRQLQVEVGGRPSIPSLAASPPSLQRYQSPLSSTRMSRATALAGAAAPAVSVGIVTSLKQQPLVQSTHMQNMTPQRQQQPPATSRCRSSVEPASKVSVSSFPPPSSTKLLAQWVVPVTA